ncbi:unnamed protein product [Lathyrus oleraceus]|uniref:Uncharacterized protein n=1 Tax=Pisum sativum TaxID=3888 RepID=A0A9D5AJD7_PEA|nr:hypothetical protein KIW84_055117 [Pisum sativum]
MLKQWAFGVQVLFEVSAVCTVGGGGIWSRDVARLHLQLAAAWPCYLFRRQLPYLCALHYRLFFSIPNLFACKELVGREGNVWLYRPNLREKVQLSVGSCELALPTRGRELAYNGNAPREAICNNSAFGSCLCLWSHRMNGTTANSGYGKCDRLWTGLYLAVLYVLDFLTKQHFLNL